MSPDDVIIVAFNAEKGFLWFGLNGNWFSGDPEKAVKPCFTDVKTPIYPVVSLVKDRRSKAVLYFKSSFRSCKYALLKVLKPQLMSNQ